MILTAEWSHWRAYPGRVAISPPPARTPLGYRKCGALFLRRPVTAADLRQRLATLDPHAVALDLFRIAYPWTPTIMGVAPAGAVSHRTIVATWLSFHTGHPCIEVDIERHEPTKVHPAHVPGLTAALSGSICT